MNYIDMFILVLLIYAVFRGFTRGFIMQLTQLAALALGIFAAIKLSHFTAAQLENHIHVSAEFLYTISLAVTFLLVFIGVNLVGKGIEKIAEAIELSFFNRMFGVLFGVLKTILILGVLLSFVDRIDRQVRFLPQNTREQSIFYKPLTSIAGTIFPQLRISESDDKAIKEVV
jgi:membrane protein required for colicin V production